jgi:hypothetical protein
MKSYTEELEAQIEALKEALTTERATIDFMNTRKDSQNYRRWCVNKTCSFKLTKGIESLLPLPHTVSDYVETCWQTLEDARSFLRFILDDIEEINPKFLTKVAATESAKADTFWQSIMTRVIVELYDQRKDKTVFSKKFTIEQTFSYSDRRVVTHLLDLEPCQIQIVDETFLHSLSDGCDYLNKWQAIMESRKLMFNDPEVEDDDGTI